MVCRRSTSSRRRRRSSAERSNSSGYRTASASRSQDASPKERERAGRSALGRCGRGNFRLGFRHGDPRGAERLSPATRLPRVLAGKLRGQAAALGALGRRLGSLLLAAGIGADLVTWIAARPARGLPRDHARQVAAGVAGALDLPLVDLLVPMAGRDLGRARAGLDRRAGAGPDLGARAGPDWGAG